MTEETVSATITISASTETVFAVLADPSRHAAVDGTGRVRDSLKSQRLTGSGRGQTEQDSRSVPGSPSAYF